MSDDLKDKLEQWKQDLATQRDEPKVQLHLLKAEARDEWDELEEKWQHFDATMGRIGDSAKESAEEIGAATEQLGEELAQAYRRLRDAIK